MSVLES